MSLYSRNETATAVTSTPPGLSQSAVVAETAGTYSVDKYDNQTPANLLYDGLNATAGAQGNAEIRSSYIYIDDAEAQLDENKYRGLTSPGWWEYTTYTDAAGNTRHKANHLVSFADAPANVPDADDAIAADVTSIISIGTDVADQSGVADPYTAVAAFSVIASATTGNLVYQWQQQTATATTRWTNLTNGATFAGTDTSSLDVTGLDKATYDGYKFRVKITSDAGAEEVISSVGTLTFAP